VIFN